MFKSGWEWFSSRVVYSTQGLITAWCEERSFRIWACMNMISCIAAFALPLGGPYRAAIICLGLLILAAECMNTAIERVVDQISTTHTPLGKAAKDTGSAAVAVTAIATGVAWGFGIYDWLA